MAISPNQMEHLSTEIRRIYEDAEIQLLRSISNKIVRNGKMADWQREKFDQIHGELLRESRKVVADLNKRIPKEIEKVIELAYLAGDKSAVNDLKNALEAIKRNGDKITDYKQIQMVLFPDPNVKIDIDATLNKFTGVNTSAIQALAGATTKTLVSTHVLIVRPVDDVFRKIITDAIGSTLTGTETRLEVAQRTLNDFANGGFRVFRDRAGRNWDIASYNEMATRTGIGQASLSGHINKMTDFGFDLVQISDHHEECELCRPWEGKVLSVSGNDPKRPSLAEATGAGLFHPNCGHRANTYFEGLTKPIVKTADPEGYEERSEQRYLERGIRQWKKRQAVAMTDKDIALSNKKVAEWSGRMEEFIDETGRRRKTNREKVGGTR